jgi:hypothetical protein
MSWFRLAKFSPAISPCNPDIPVGCPLVGLHGGWGPWGGIKNDSMNNTTFSLFTLGSLDTWGPSSSRKRRLVEQTIDLQSFICNEVQGPTKPRFLLMTATEEGKTLKCVSACRLARSIGAVAGTLQVVTLQRSGSILLEARTDQQIVKLLSLNTTEGSPGAGCNPPNPPPL